MNLHNNEAGRRVKNNKIILKRVRVLWTKLSFLWPNNCLEIYVDKFATPEKQDLEYGLHKIYSWSIENWFYSSGSLPINTFVPKYCQSFHTQTNPWNKTQKRLKSGQSAVGKVVYSKDILGQQIERQQRISSVLVSFSKQIDRFFIH